MSTFHSLAHFPGAATSEDAARHKVEDVPAGSTGEASSSTLSMLRTEHEPDTLDAVAGSEFVDDRIRLDE